MKQLHLLLAVHSHQPVGNFGWVFEEAYDKAYLPFLETLKRHPRIKAVLHYSGCLFDWFESYRPDFLLTLRAMVAKGQVELLSGGYYEPILPMIPERDRSGQIEMLSGYIKNKFKYAPRGLWTAERVWEQHLAKSLSDANIEYTILDDSHFEYAGINPEEALGYYVTEEDGRGLCVFPGSERLRYLIPFKEPQECIDYLKQLSQKAPSRPCGITYADDGEKFGLWPGTHKWVYQERWLDKFFTALDENEDFVKTAHFSDYIEKFPATGRIYIPCASYKEMMEWSGGYFRNFLVKYPEANNMHKKMLYVSEKLDKAEAAVKGHKKELERAKRELYMAQCNCGYWHGVFGGLYLNHLRSAVYNHLIESEKMIDRLIGEGSRLASEALDFDVDGEEELILSAPQFNLYFDPKEGGSLFELDVREHNVNLANVLTRRHEPYHEKIREKIKKGSANSQGPDSIHDLVLSKEEGLDRYLVYDRYRRNTFIDHFFRQDISAEAFFSGKYEELGDFTAGAYEANAKKTKTFAEVTLKRKGMARLGEFENPYVVAKTVKVACPATNLGGVISVAYRVQNEGRQYLPVRFGCELNLAVQDQRLLSAGEVSLARNMQIDDTFTNLKLDFKFAAYTDVFYFPIETVSVSEEGFERTYQGLCLLFHWPLSAAGGKASEVGFSITIR